MVTVTLTTVPKPATLMFDGYGLAGPLSGMVIGAVLAKLEGLQAGVGVAVAVAVAVGVGLGVPVGVGVGVPPPARLNAPIRSRHPMELLLGLRISHQRMPDTSPFGPLPAETD
jgi:hypothetical protein